MGMGMMWEETWELNGKWECGYWNGMGWELGTYSRSPLLGGAAVRRRTRDRKVADSTPGKGAIKSTRSTQPSIPPG